jgi:dihydropteroate synthase
VQALAAEFDLPISVDTYKAAVAEAALQAGAHLINDVWGLRADPDLAGVAARYKAPVILMHNRSSWAHAEIKDRLGGRYVGMAYDDLWQMCARTARKRSLAHAAGILMSISSRSRHWLWQDRRAEPGTGRLPGRNCSGPRCC